MLQHFFDFKGRLRRWPYFASATGLMWGFGLLAWLLIFPVSGAHRPFSMAAVGQLIDHPFETVPRIDNSPLIALALLALISMVGWSFAALSVKRLCDAGQAPHWAWLAIPFSPGLLMLSVLLLPSSTGRPMKELLP